MNPSRPPLPHRAAWPRLLTGALLALLLLFAQQQATLHALWHATEAAQAGGGKQAPAPNHACDECTVLAALAGAMPAPAVAVLPEAAARHEPPAARPVRAGPSPLRLGYRSRAPPNLS